MSNLPSLRHPQGGRIAIVAGLRTPFVRQLGAFKQQSALDLGKILVTALINKTAIEPSLIDQLVFGQVVQMPKAPNIAREIVLGTPMSINTDAYTVSRACATSFQSVASVAQSIATGSIEVAIAGGADSFSLLPIGASPKLAACLLALSKTKKYAEKITLLAKLSLKDLLPVAPAIAEYSTGLRMGDTAEQMAKTFGISREEQDSFAHRSHVLAAQAWQSEWIQDEVMIAFPEPYKEWVKEDTNIRHHSVLEDYAKLAPVFDKKYGSVTAANSSPLTDGASAVLMMSESKAKALGLTPLGFIRSFAFSAIAVQENMLLGPAYAVPVALEKAELSLSDMDVIEMHEAFAAQVLANVDMLASNKFAKEKLNLSRAVGKIELDKLNVHGGSIAYGHPFAATGTRMIVQSLRELQKRGSAFALNTACAAGGLGVAMVLEANHGG